MAFRDREMKSVMLMSYPMLSVRKSNQEGMDTKAPCPAGCDEDGRCVLDCFRCAGFGYVHKDGESKVRVVAAEGRVRDWAAYAEVRSSVDAYLEFDSEGIPITDLVRSEAIHYHGSKLVQKEAEAIFPDWAEQLTWRE